MKTENQKAPLFSIIVPVYNVRDYVEKCIASVLNQSFRDFELLLIDDGSTDGSGEYIDIVASQDARVRTFHQANSGVSAARNLGLDKAVGQWIVFVDGDDALVPNALQILSECISDHPEVELITYDFERVSSLSDTPQAAGPEYSKTVYDCSGTVNYRALDRYMVWSEAFGRGSFAGLRFEKLRNGEDVVFCNTLACRAGRCMDISAKLYQYLQREYSAKVNVWDKRRFEDCATMNRLILNNLLSCDKNIDRTWLKRWVGGLLLFVPQLWQEDMKFRIEYYLRHRKLLKEVRRLKNLPKYLSTWISVATLLESVNYFKAMAMCPMRLYSRLKNR